MLSSLSGYSGVCASKRLCLLRSSMAICNYPGATEPTHSPFQHLYNRQRRANTQRHASVAEPRCCSLAAEAGRWKLGCWLARVRTKHKAAVTTMQGKGGMRRYSKADEKGNRLFVMICFEFAFEVVACRFPGECWEEVWDSRFCCNSAAPQGGDDVMSRRCRPTMRREISRSPRSDALFF